jgi:hypothetical protein
MYGMANQSHTIPPLCFCFFLISRQFVNHAYGGVDVFSQLVFPTCI